MLGLTEDGVVVEHHQCNPREPNFIIIASDGKVKREVSRRLALGYAAFNKLGKQGIWKRHGL